MSRIDPKRLLALLVLVAAIVGASPGRAQACSCVEWPPEKRMADADQVFLGRYVRPGPDGDGNKVRFDVLLSVKGDVGRTFELPRQTELTCERSFQDRELSLVLVVKGRIPICAGNFDLDKILPSLGEYLALGGRATAAPALDAVKVALAGKLRGKKVSVYAPALAGKSVQLGTTRASFVDARGEELHAVSGATSDGVTYVVWRTPDAIANWFLVAPVKGKLTVVYELKRDLKIK